MKKRLTAILMVLIMSLALLAGCEDNSSNSRSSRNSRNEESEATDDSAEALSFNIFSTTEDFDEMMDAYKEFYNEFCRENLKPYYEDQTEGDCAAMIVVNPDDNKFMMVIADTVGFNSSSGMNVDLCFYEYSQGEVKEYLTILNIWTPDAGIFVTNIADGLYVSYPNSEYIQYKIENGEAKELTQSIFWRYSLTECIFTDGDSDANNFCVSERLFENYLDYLKEHTPENVTDLKVIYGDYLLENRVTTHPLTFIVYDDIEYYYVREEKLIDDNGHFILDRYNHCVFDIYNNNNVFRWGYAYDNRFINGNEPDMRGYLFPCVDDLLAHEYPESIDGYEVYPFRMSMSDEEFFVSSDKQLCDDVRTAIWRVMMDPEVVNDPSYTQPTGVNDLATVLTIGGSTFEHEVLDWLEADSAQYVINQLKSTCHDGSKASSAGIMVEIINYNNVIVYVPGGCGRAEKDSCDQDCGGLYSGDSSSHSCIVNVE